MSYSYFSKYLKYKTKYLNLYNQNGGGDFTNFKFGIEGNNSLTGYEYIEKIKGHNNNFIINISVDYVNIGETRNINIKAHLTSKNKENLPPIVKSMENPIYFTIDDIEEKPQEYCIWLGMDKKNPSDIYFGYIRSEGFNCYTPINELPQDDLLMKTIIKFAKYVGFKTISVIDHSLSKKICTYEEKDQTTGHEFKFNQQRNLKIRTLLKTGHTFFGKYGFRPETPKILEKYNRISKILNRPIREFNFDKNSQLISLKDSLNTLDHLTGDNKVIGKFQKIYLEALYKPENQDKLFTALNMEFINTNCYYEIIIRDLYFSQFLVPGESSFHAEHFEKMKLDL